MDFLTDPLFTEFGRSDFIGGIDNEALDFGHLEQFIHAATSTSGSNVSSRVSPADVNDVLVATSPNNGVPIQSHLPESPPDSSSEPPFSPVDLQGLTLTSRSAASNSASTHDGSLIDVSSSLAPRQHIKSSTDLHTLTHPRHNLQHNHNIHQHLYIEHNDQHSLLLAATPLHQQPMHRAESTIASPTSVASDIYSPDNRPEHDKEHSDSLLVIDSHHHHQQRPQTNNNIHVTNISEIIDMEAAERTSYNGQTMMITPQSQHHTPSIITSDVYMGTPAGVIESTTLALLPSTRKRKLSQVDCCASMKTIKPEPGLSPICHQKLNPTSPVSINLQQIGALTGEASSGSPSSSLSPTATSLSLSNENNSLDGGGSSTPNGASFVNCNAADSSSESSPMQCIRFSPFQQHNWHTLCDQSLQELSMAHYRVDADKGFNFSVSDDAFVCQKKNHFQITCHARLQGEAKFVRTPTGLEKIKSFHLHFYGVKLEAPNQTIRVEQSQSDRSKKPFYPVPIDLQSHLVSKVTVGRLHFSETTNNNMRKKGRPNPEQRYFQLVVGLHVHTHSGHFPIASQGSERIIVRASNPGQFESDVELCWQRGITSESIFHAGRVGINTDRPDESLVIHGNLKVSGHIIQPSDSRAKQEISELDTAVQLRNLQKIRIVRYRYEPEFAVHSGLKSDKDNEEIIDTGVIAQEVREVLPDAVQEAGSIVLPSGQIIDNFLLVNKDRILMENIGAVKELCKVTGSLETRIEQLEKINNRLMRMQEVGQKKKKFNHLINDGVMEDEDEMCSNRTIQMMIIILVIIMATCLVAVSTLYFVEHSKQRYMKRYDRYDISHHLVSHDAILINNNNNPRNHNRNGYHTNKNGKLILHTHTLHPPLVPLLTPLSESQQTSNFPLMAQPSDIPISGIPSSYPSAGSESGFNFHGTNIDTEIYKNIRSGTERPGEELPQNKTDYAVNMHATNHPNNKTGSSKNKSKWPVSSETTATVSSAITLTYNFNDDPIEENINVSETSSEKVSDSIPLPQDFENNSIDGADTSQKPDVHGNSLNGNLPIDIGTIASTTRSNGKAVPESIGIGAVKIDNIVDSSSTSSSSSIFVVYKKSQGKNINDTISQPVNFTIETPPITNKSRGIDTEDADLQYLGNNNDSDGQSLVEIATVPMIAKTFALSPIGIPDHCMKIKREEISNCQSACFEDTNNLPSQNSDVAIRRRHIQILTPRNSTTIMSATAFTSGDTSPNRKQQSAIDDSSDATASMERIHSDEFDENQENDSSKSQVSQQQIEAVREELTTALKDKKQPHKDSKRKIDSIEILSLDDPTPSSGCSSVTPWLQADTFNVSLGYEEICLNGGSSLNITYMIPLSKYLKDTNVELHFITPANLHWSICSNKEKTKRDGNNILNPLSNGKMFQKSQNVSIFHLVIPGHGHFERIIELRAAMDSTKNLCREQPNETNVLLQYNIRIIRDCD